MNPQTNAAIKKIGILSKEIGEQLSIIDRYSYDKLKAVIEETELKKHELQSIDDEYQVKLVRANADFDLKVMANRKAACEEYAAENGFKFIEVEELNELQAASYDVDKKIGAAVGKAVGKATSDIETKHKLSNNEQTIKIAQLEGELSPIAAQIKFLEAQITRLTTELEQAGQRIVAVANANSAVVNVESKK